jgi:membrane protein DedA with SNARE-associated domain
MLDESLKALIGQGILGIVALISLYVAGYLYRELKEERGRHSKEMRDLEERYVTKAETWIGKYHDLSSSITSALQALQGKQRKVPKDDD